MIKKHFITAILISFSIITIFSQENVVKLGIPGLAIRNININYERVINDKQSFILNLGIQIPRPVPSFLGLELINDAKNEFKGYSIIPEYRFYTSSKKSSRGFYVAPYLKYNKYSATFSDSYDYSTGTQTETVNADALGSFSTIGAGVQLGVHWIISDIVSIDWYFLGLDLSRRSLNFEFTTDEDGINYNDLASAIETNLKNNIPIIGSKVKTEAEGNTIITKVPFFSPGIRSGFSIGIAF